MIKSLKRPLPAALAVFSSAPAWAQGYEPHPHMWDYGWGWGWGMMILGPVMMIAIFAGVVAVAVLIVRWLSGGGAAQQTPSGDRSTALDVLKERFARGEIDKDEYQERRRLLSD